MRAVDKIEVEIFKLGEILRRRGMFYEDEKGAHEAYLNVKKWMDDEVAETERIELEAAAAAEIERRNDPNFRTREMFKNVKINIPRKEMR